MKVKITLIALASLLLSACGGGSAPQATPSVSAVLLFSPSSIVQTVSEGESVPITINATPSNTLSGLVYLIITDTTGVITTNVQITKNANGTYTAVMNSSPTLAVGNHQGRIEVKVCQDVACNAQFPGSPLYIDYDISVVSNTNLTPLTKWNNVNDWETFQANAAHTGYVPVTLNANNFSQRWRWTVPESNNKVSPAVIANGLVYVSSSGYFASSSKLYALKETDKSIAWQHDFGSVNALNPPAVSAGKVFAATSGHADTFMWGFSADAGVQQFSTAFLAQWPGFYAPTIDNGIVYTNGGYYSGLNSFNTSDGSNAWFRSLNQYDKWTPAVDATNAYAYLGESCSGCNNAGLTIMNKSTGAVVYTIPDPQHNWTGWSINGSPVVGANGNVFAINQANNNYANHLISFNTQALSINWSISGTFNINPTLANGVIYLANKSPLQLEARDETSGTLLWKWTPTEANETGFYGNIVATDNMVFVSTNSKVYAIDINTHTPVWNYWKPGELALSNNGVLYITTSNGSVSDGALVAINLK